MKKFSTVLLIAVLAVSTVFAAFSGTFEAGVGYDFDENKWGYGETTGLKADWSYNFDFSQTFSADGASAGSKTPYAVIEGNATLATAYGSDDDDNKDWNKAQIKIEYNSDKEKSSKDTKTVDLQSVEFTLTAELTKAQIIGENWSIDFLEGKWGQDWAKSAIDFVNRKNGDKTYTGYYNNDLSETVSLPSHNTVLFEYEGYKLTLGLKDDNEKFEKVNAGVAFETKEFTFDGGTAAAFGSVGFKHSETNTTLVSQGSLKAEYATDELAVAAAADVAYDKKVKADAALKASYDFLSFDAYYATDAKVTVKKGSNVLFNDTIQNLLSAKLAANLEEYKTTVTVEALDIIHKQDFSVDVNNKYFDGHELKAGVENVLALNDGNEELKEDGPVVGDTRRVYASAVVTVIDAHKVKVGSDDILNKDLYAEINCTKVEKLDLTVGAKDILDKVNLSLDAIYTGVDNHTLELKAGYEIKAHTLDVEYIGGYTGDLLDATLRAKFHTDFAGKSTLGVYASAESETIVDGAKLGIEYGTFIKDKYRTQWLGKEWGTIRAYCTMSF